MRAGLAALAIALSAPAAAEVVSSAPTGFATRNAATVAAAPPEVWAALVQPARYWNPQHSWSGDAENFALDPRAGGCFCEALPKSGGSVKHAEVLYADPGAQLRMSGAFGPLQSEALTGTLTVKLTAVEGGTRIEWSYLVGGYASFDLAGIAPAVDGVMAEQLTRLAGLLRPKE
jgi:uncharacterized protein YndB with AHSA1/START domain